MHCANAVFKRLKIKKDLLEEKHIESSSDSSNKTAEDFSLWSNHHILVNRKWKSNRTEEGIFDELSVYLNTAVGQLSENSLEVRSNDK